MKKTIGIFGGTFDPIHNGHLFIAEYLCNHLNLDKLLFTPAGETHHKRPKAKPFIRFVMCKRAIENNPKFDVCGVDISRPGPIYTIDTIRILREKYNKTNIVFLIGADNISDIKNWKDYKTLIKTVKIIAIKRSGGYSLDPKIDDQTIDIIPAPTVNISSTKIRGLIKKGDSSARYMVPFEVWECIRKEGLYHE